MRKGGLTTVRISSCKYVVRDAFRSLWRNRFMSFASLATVAISLVILGFAWMMMINADHMAGVMESELEINVYLRPNVDSNRAAELKDFIQKLSDIDEVVFVPKEEGLNLLNGRFGNDVDLAESLGGENPLPDMFRIRVKQADQIPDVGERIQRLAGVDMVRYGQEMIEQLLQLTQWVRSVGLVVVVATAVAALFLIATTIRLAVFSRSGEISIMQLVGATNWYIRWPFFLEGMVIGLLGAMVSVVALYLFYAQVAEHLTGSMSFIPIVTDYSVMFVVYRGLIIFGGCLGALGSVFSMRRFLRI
ncbi:MAG: permease-like cell division protein FtsX [Peptococcaceae bacterium]|nr:permease-like cell division protein FtsX [Peptococcaceae bacterium]